MERITKERLVQKLEDLIEDAEKVRDTNRSQKGGLNPGPIFYSRSVFAGWISSILSVLESSNIDTVERRMIEQKHKISNVYEKDIKFIEEQLKSILSLIEEGFIDVCVDQKMCGEEQLENILNRFHKVTTQIKKRHCHRESLEIKDEYDAQDLLHALLLLHFEDVRPEEWTPSYAGGAVRMDFLLKDEGIVIEVKKTRQSMTAKSLGEELLIDREKYKVHPDCKKIYCFVYDPEELLGNPVGIKRDLEQGTGDFIKVFIRPE